MANLTHKRSTDTFRAPTGDYSFAVTDAVQLLGGGLVGTLAAGTLDKWQDVAGVSFQGWLKESVLGDATTDPNDPVMGAVDTSGTTIDGVTVAGVTDATEMDSLVYCATDNVDDCTLTPTANAKAIARVVRVHGANLASIKLFTPAEYALQS